MNKKKTAASVMGYSAAIAAFYVFLTSPRLHRPDMSKIDCDFAHRGIWGASTPENSLASIKKAVDMGFGVEFDIRLTKDKKIVVFHDDNTQRMCRIKKTVKDTTYRELSALRLFGGEEKIPLLSEVLRLVDGKVPLLIELKGENTNTELSARAAKLLDKYTGAFCIESFNPFLLRWFKKNRPDYIRGQLITPYRYAGASGRPVLNALMSTQLINVISKPDFISFDKRFHHNPGVASSVNLWRAKPFVWTVRSQEEIDEMHRRGKRVIFDHVIPQKNAETVMKESAEKKSV